jgi:hypothetical protein
MLHVAFNLLFFADEIIRGDEYQPAFRAEPVFSFVRVEKKFGGGITKGAFHRIGLCHIIPDDGRSGALFFCVRGATW